MKKRNYREVLLIIAGLLLVIELPWYIFTQVIVNHTEVKTTGIVTEIKSYTPYCSHLLGNTKCDNRLTYAPTYKYIDTQGTVHYFDNRELSEYKKSDFLYRFFAKQAGDRATIYYDKNNPSQAVVMDNPWAYTAWFIPLLLFLVLVFIVAIDIAGRYLINWLQRF